MQIAACVLIGLVVAGGLYALSAWVAGEDEREME